MAAGRDLLSPEAHIAQFYECDSDLEEAVAAYLADGLAGGGTAVVIATPEHSSAFVDHLVGVDVASVRGKGRLVVLDAAQTLAACCVDDRIDPAAFDAVVGRVVDEAAHHGTPVHAYGEMVALLWDQGQVNAALELEGLWNTLTRRLPFSLFCGYSLQKMDGQTEGFNDVCAAHSAVFGLAPTEAGSRLPTGFHRVRTNQARRFECDVHSARAARQFVTELLERWEIYDPFHEAALVVTELATNAIRHARSDFIVAVSVGDACVQICVRDESPVPISVRDPEPSALSGRGLVLVSSLAHRWGSRAQEPGKLVWAELQRAAPSPGVSP